MTLAHYATTTSVEAAAGGGGRASFSFAHDSGAGDDRLLVVAVLVRHNETALTVSTLTYADVALTKVANASQKYNYTASASVLVEWWYLSNPASGSNTLAGVYSGTAAFGDVIVASTFTGANQGSPIGASGTTNSGGSTTTPSVGITTQFNNSFVVGAAAKRRGAGGSFTPGTDDVELADLESGTGTSGDICAYVAYEAKATAGSTTVSGTHGTESTQWVMGAIEIKEAAAAITVDLDALGVVTSVDDLAVEPGEVAIALDALQVVASQGDLTIVPGAIAIDLEALIIAAAMQDLTAEATNDQEINLQVLAVSTSVPDLDVEPGAIAVDLDALGVAVSWLDLDVEPGDVAITLAALQVLAALGELDVEPGPVVIDLDSLIVVTEAVTIDDHGPQAGPRYGLLAWYPLDVDGADLHAEEDLSEVGTISYVEGKVAEGAELESANGEYLGRSTTAFQHGDGSFTVQGWVKFVSVASEQRYIASNGSVTNNRLEWAIRRNGDRLEFLHTTNGAAGTVSFLQSSVVMTAGVWYFFSAKWDAATDVKSLTVNTTTVTAGSVSTVFSGSQEFYLGFLHDFTANTMNGVIDNATLYNRALAASEISWHYNGGDGRNYADSAPTIVFSEPLILPLGMFSAAIEPGETEVDLEPLAAVLGMATLDVEPGEIQVLLDVLGVATSLGDVAVIPGETLIALQPLQTATSMLPVGFIGGDIAVDLAALLVATGMVDVTAVSVFYSLGRVMVWDQRVAWVDIWDEVVE